MRRGVAFVLVFALGGSAGWIASRTRGPEAAAAPPIPAELREVVTVHEPVAPDRVLVHHLRPHAVRVGDTVTRFRDPPPNEGRSWAILLRDERVMILCERVDPPTEPAAPPP